ncbi:MAG: hypothetical protein JW874_08435 [Spirochaetales bacterium]|nr:hypothetical protein [Spirochaetales bacterium]
MKSIKKPGKAFCAAAILFLVPFFMSCELTVMPRGRTNPNDPYAPLVLTYISYNSENYSFSVYIHLPDYYDGSWAEEDIPEAIVLRAGKGYIPDRANDGSPIFGFPVDYYSGDLTWEFPAQMISDFNSTDYGAVYYFSFFWTNDYIDNYTSLYEGYVDDSDNWMGPLTGSYYF